MIIGNDIFSHYFRQLYGGIVVYDENGEYLGALHEHSELQEFTIERVGESGKFFGFGICQKASVKLRSDTIGLKAKHMFEACIDDVEYLQTPCPRFQITQVHKDEVTGEVSITAYDYLYEQFLKDYTVADLMLSAYTIREFAYTIAALIGLNGVKTIGVADSDFLFDLEYPNGANFEGTEGIREALNAIAEATQTIYYIDNHHYLVFKKLVNIEPCMDITPDNYFEFTSGANRRLTAICSATELGDNVTASSNITGTTQYIRDNPFLELRDDIADILDAALALTRGLTINQFDLKWRGNYFLEIGDLVRIIKPDGASVEAFILNDVITYNGGLEQHTQWHYDEVEETESNPSTLGGVLKQTYAKVDKANKQIELVASQTQEIAKETSNEIYNLTQKVSQTITPEQVNILVQEEMAKGIDKVTTSTGFTFNSEGLKVEKANSEMSTIISEDGMQVNKNDETVLTANNEGVKAIDLHATTYLIVGNNSRFEDYGSGRTGCFWIGG